MLRTNLIFYSYFKYSTNTTFKCSINITGKTNTHFRAHNMSEDPTTNPTMQSKPCIPHIISLSNISNHILHLPLSLHVKKFYIWEKSDILYLHHTYRLHLTYSSNIKSLTSNNLTSYIFITHKKYYIRNFYILYLHHALKF